MTLPVGDKAVALIVGEEIGSFATYTKLYQRPNWPGGKSGITCGIGYDLGQHTAAQIRADWAPHLSETDVSMLCAVAGFKGVDAHDRLRSVETVVIPIALAEAVFTGSVLPRYAAETATELSNCDLLPPDAFGALVSVSYNRGWGGWNDDGDRYKEMNAISDAMDDKRFGDVPAQLDAMKRLWAEGSDLWKRRQHEAALFREAMAAAKAAPPAVPATSPGTPIADQVINFVKSIC